MICEILRYFANTLTADDKYSLRNSENIPQPIQMQLSKKQEKFDQYFAEFLKFTKILKVLKKEMTLIADGFSKSKRAEDLLS